MFALIQCELPGVRRFKDGVELPASCLNMPATLNALALTLGRNCMEICVSLYLKHRHKFLSQELHSRGWNKNVSGQVSVLLVCMCILNRIQTKGLDVKCAQIEKGKIKEQIFGRISLINEMLLFCRCCFLFFFCLRMHFAHLWREWMITHDPAARPFSHSSTCLRSVEWSQ